METHLRWFVPATTKITTPAGSEPLHDDRLISAALIAEADRLIREGKIHTGTAQSMITEYYDPLDDLPDWQLISVALPQTGVTAEGDKLLRDGRLLLGRAESIISAAYDPLEDLPKW